MNCVKCNTSLEYGDKVCPNCGHRISGQSRRVSDSVSSGIAFVVTLLRTIFFIYAVFLAIFASKGQYAGLTFTVILIGVASISLLWAAVIRASESNGWAIFLSILGVIDIINGFRGSLLTLIAGIVYLVYAIKCLGD